MWPALLPPWKRITRSAFSASRSVILPLPSSPHWAPMITMPAMSCGQSTRRRAGGRRRSAGGLRRPSARRRRLARAAGRLAAARTPVARWSSPNIGLRIAADLVHARHRAVADLVAQRVVAVDRDQVRRQQDRLAVLVARVDDRVELLEHPRRRLLGADVVDVQQVDGAEPVDQLAERVRARRRRTSRAACASSRGSE